MEISSSQFNFSTLQEAKILGSEILYNLNCPYITISVYRYGWVF